MAKSVRADRVIQTHSGKVLKGDFGSPCLVAAALLSMFLLLNFGTFVSLELEYAKTQELTMFFVLIEKGARNHHPQYPFSISQPQY